MKLKLNLLLAASAALLLAGCEKDGGGVIIPVAETRGYWILGEGTLGNENSTLYYYDLTTQSATDRFTEANPGEAVGNTANDMKIYGSKLYVAVDQSNQVLVVDAVSGRLLERLDMGQADGSDREPRAVACAGGKAFVSLYSGEVARIDTTTFEVDYVSCHGSSRWNEGIAAVNEQVLAVAQSRQEGNTVTLIDIPSFTVQGQVTVPTNPSELAVTKDGDVYLATWGDYATEGPALHKLDLTARSYTTIPGVEVLRIAIHGGTLYGVNTTYAPPTFDPVGSLVRVDLSTHAVEKMVENRPGSFNGVNVNPLTGYLYVMQVDADYSTSTILPFDNEGKPLSPITDIGRAVNTVAFRNTRLK
jgi:hypothetical protein